MGVDNLLELINKVDSQEKLENVFKDLRIVSINEKMNNQVIEIIDKTILKAKETNSKKILLNLYSLKITQIHHLKSKIQDTLQIIHKMQLLLEKLDYNEGCALYYSHLWYIEKLQGNKERAKIHRDKSMEILSENNIEDEFIYYTCKYTYAVEKWFEEHDSESVTILEECGIYFFNEGLYRSLAQTIGLLCIIYARINENAKALDISSQILAKRYLFENLPLDVKGIIYYFAGWGNLLNANLIIAETYFDEAYCILKPIYKGSIYLSNFLILQSYLIIAKGLQGKTEQAYIIIKEANLLLQTDHVKEHLDDNTRKQVIHNLNLAKFYLISRLNKFDYQDHRELTCEIVEGCTGLYSDFMTLSEFILNSNFDILQLQQLLEVDNFSLNRVKHLIEFMIEKRKSETEINRDQKALNCIAILNNREITRKTTFTEHVYADLLIAQQLFSLKQYAEISPLLKRYESRLTQIEVLEMRIFMEAFIQVGAFKNGDPLGPALQYMAIKKCRDYGFSRLENKLLDYLQLQHKEIKRAI